MKRAAFTLIELLVVIAIIAILAAILFPVFAQAKSAAKQSANVSNMKQIALAGLLYSSDYDDGMPASGDNGWGKYYWLFLWEPYIKGKPNQIDKPRNNIFFSPLAPDGVNFQELADDRATQVWPQPAMSWGFNQLYTNEDGEPALRYWATYGINEHIPDDWPFLSAWEVPAESFLILESTDSEIEGDELDELFGRDIDCTATYPDLVNADPTRGGHNGGTTIAYLDGHVKWRKIEWGPQGPCGVITNSDGDPIPSFNFPPSHPEGGRNARLRGWTGPLQ